MADRLLNRIGALLKVRLDDLLLDAADPQDAAWHYVGEMESGLAQAKDAVAAAVASERQLERQWQEARASSDEWGAKADAALRADDEERARRALQHKLVCERAAARAQEELDRQRQAVAEMKEGLSALQAKMEEVRKQIKSRKSAR